MLACRQYNYKINILFWKTTFLELVTYLLARYWQPWLEERLNPWLDAEACIGESSLCMAQQEEKSKTNVIVSSRKLVCVIILRRTKKWGIQHIRAHYCHV